MATSSFVCCEHDVVPVHIPEVPVGVRLRAYLLDVPVPPRLKVVEDHRCVIVIDSVRGSSHDLIVVNVIRAVSRPHSTQQVRPLAISPSSQATF